MTTPENLGTFHALLIGIDQYSAGSSLRGCVNDVDAIEELLQKRLGVPSSSIAKLVSPRTRALRTSSEKPATLSNIRAAFANLAERREHPWNRILVYYSGHGGQVWKRDSAIYREALFPADFDTAGMLFDAEVNTALGSIARQTKDLTVVLDCCNSAGATRAVHIPTEDRYLEWEVRELPSFTNSPPSLGLLSRSSDPMAHYLVVAACHADERAREQAFPASSHYYGIFTHAWLQELAQYDDARLRSVRWRDVWDRVCERVTDINPNQHPVILGTSARRVFGGPFQAQDAGYSVRAEGDGYRIGAGSLFGVAKDAEVAIYGPHPDRFFPLGSNDDVAMRLGLVTVTEDSHSSSFAMAKGAPFALVEGARGRLVTSSSGDRLRVAMSQSNPQLAELLAAQASVQIVSPDEPDVEIFLECQANGMLKITDELKGAGVVAQVPTNNKRSLIRFMHHLNAYMIVCRLRKRCIDLQGALEVLLLDCQDKAKLAEIDPQAPELPEIGKSNSGYNYRVFDDDAVCFVVRNKGPRALYVWVFNCFADGGVDILADHVQIHVKSQQTIWFRGMHRKPFGFNAPEDGRLRGVDRIVAIGTTMPGVDLRFLALDRTLSEAMGTSTRGLMGRIESGPREQWTAIELFVEIVRRRGGQ